MNCPHCQSSKTIPRHRITNLGYIVLGCQHCQRSFNERTGIPFNFIEVPTDVVFQVLLCWLRYKLSVRDVTEFFLIRGFAFTHETVRDWEERFAPLFVQQLRAKRQGKADKVWHGDETCVRVKGKWCYLYRAMDQDGNLVDSIRLIFRPMVLAALSIASISWGSRCSRVRFWQLGVFRGGVVGMIKTCPKMMALHSYEMM